MAGSQRKKTKSSGDPEREQNASALAEVVEFLEKQGWEYCLVGGLAAAYWGRPRSTNDVDLVLLTELGDEQSCIQRLLKGFQVRVAGADKFALKSRVLLLKSRHGVGIDISLGALPFEVEMLRRATVVEVLPNLPVRTATPEDIVVMKSIAGRPRDVDDIERIIATQGKNLDSNYIRHWLEELSEFWIEKDLVGFFEQTVASVNERMRKTPRGRPPRQL